ncbi:MAG: hypothetical protein V1855_01185, partial [bacterium]
MKKIIIMLTLLGITGITHLNGTKKGIQEKELQEVSKKFSELTLHEWNNETAEKLRNNLQFDRFINYLYQCTKTKACPFVLEWLKNNNDTWSIYFKVRNLHYLLKKSGGKPDLSEVQKTVEQTHLLLQLIAIDCTMFEIMNIHYSMHSKIALTPLDTYQFFKNKMEK